MHRRYLYSLIFWTTPGRRFSAHQRWRDRRMLSPLRLLIQCVGRETLGRSRQKRDPDGH